MRSLSRLTAAAVLGAGLMAFAGAASARVVCNDDGDCWHSAEGFEFDPGLRLSIHPDNWKWEGDRYHWREHDGRGYWHGGSWVEIH